MRIERVAAELLLLTGACFLDREWFRTVLLHNCRDQKIFLICFHSKATISWKGTNHLYL